MWKRALTGSLEIEEALYVKGNGKSASGCHAQHHDKAVADTPAAPGESDGAFQKELCLYFAVL
jgi:hypothetical protein